MDVLGYYVNNKKIATFQLHRDGQTRIIGKQATNAYVINGNEVDDAHLYVCFHEGVYKMMVVGNRVMGSDAGVIPSNTWLHMPESQKIYLDTTKRHSCLVFMTNINTQNTARQTQRLQNPQLRSVQQTQRIQRRDMEVPVAKNTTVFKKQQTQASIQENLIQREQQKPKESQPSQKVQTSAEEDFANLEFVETSLADTTSNDDSLASVDFLKAPEKSKDDGLGDIAALLGEDDSLSSLDIEENLETKKSGKNAKKETGEDIGNVIADRYRIVGTLGKGGMGIVYRAMDEKLKRPVALKFLITKENSPKDSHERFLREAQAVARLKHDHIIAVHDMGIYQGKPYFTMDIIEGKELKECLLPFKPRLLMQWLLKICEALHYVHEAGIIHRDLKPANIIISKDNEPILMDFGLARDDSKRSELTAEGQALGTPAYMAPEQAKGLLNEIDKRVDIYGLGAILYELLTGQPPFSGPPMQVLYKVCTVDPPPVKELNESIPEDLVGIVEKAMNKEKQLRYNTAKEMANDVKRYLNGLRVHAKPASKFVKFVRAVRRYRGFNRTFVIALAIVSLFIGKFLWDGYQENRRKEALINKSYTEASEAFKILKEDSSMTEYVQVLDHYNQVLAIDKNHQEARENKFEVLKRMALRAEELKDFSLAIIVYDIILETYNNSSIKEARDKASQQEEQENIRREEKIEEILNQLGKS